MPRLLRQQPRLNTFKTADSTFSGFLSEILSHGHLPSQLRAALRSPLTQIMRVVPRRQFCPDRRLIVEPRSWLKMVRYQQPSAAAVVEKLSVACCDPAPTLDRSGA